jgi:hypothetical protein
MLCTMQHCVLHYLNQFCFYVANCFVTEIVYLGADQDVFAWYVSSPWDVHHC